MTDDNHRRPNPRVLYAVLCFAIVFPLSAHLAGMDGATIRDVMLALLAGRFGR
jgi:ABC-type transport system involved in cytochrome c biogenesis permease component